MAKWITPWVLNLEVTGSNHLAATVVARTLTSLPSTYKRTWNRLPPPPPFASALDQLSYWPGKIKSISNLCLPL